MVHQAHESDSSVATSGSVPPDPISKRLVSSDFSPAQQVELIEKMLADKYEQQAARGLELREASRLVEMLDLVLGNDGLDASVRPSCVRYLARVCAWHKLLPISAQISAYERDSLHASGGYSEIYFGRYNDQKVIVKVLRYYSGDDLATKEKRIKAFCKEVITWKNLSHPNILPLIGAAMVNEEGRAKYEIVSELMENGNINAFIKQNAHANRLELLKDIVQGLKYLHSQLVVHGDLKGLNILIKKDGHACLADFGLTRINAEFTSSGPDKSEGTLLWMSPEMLYPDMFGCEKAKPTMESDVYSFGVVIYELICGHGPFPDMAPWTAVDLVLKGVRPTQPTVGFADSLWRITESCWQHERKDRPSASTVAEWLDEVSRA